MEQISKFSPEVAKELKYYVYRLIDPRNGQTFYVGKGKNNRVFAHVNQALKNYDGEDYATKEEQEEDFKSAKLSTIQDIKNAGLDVIHIIHRYGLNDDKIAFEVESAVMDCYLGLTNIQSGHYSERSSKNTITLEKELSRKCYEEPKDIDYIIFKISQERIDNEGIYNATRSAWVLDKNKAEKYKYALCVVDGIVKGVFEVDSWQTNINEPKRIEFNGKEAPDTISSIFLEKRIPEKYRQKGQANPALYKK